MKYLEKNDFFLPYRPTLDIDLVSYGSRVIPASSRLNFQSFANEQKHTVFSGIRNQLYSIVSQNVKARHLIPSIMLLTNV